MKWIEYDYTCNADKGVTLRKKVEYTDENLVIAQAEACNGEYTITEDDGEYNHFEPLHTGNKELIFTYGTEDLIAGTTPLETGKLYFVYE